MFSYNRVQLIGYQTQPLALRQTPNGSSVTDLNIVVPYQFKAESGQVVEGKSFQVVTLWGPMADIAGKYVKPGSQLFISGRLQTDSWQDESTNEKRSKTKVVGLDMIMLDPKDGQGNALPSGSAVTPGLNRADVIGNVTRDPELRTTTGGQQVLSLGVATNEKWRDKSSNEDRERTEFHNVVVWGKLAEQVNTHVQKGKRVFVSGRIQTRSWETTDGKKRTTTEIIADTVQVLGTKHAATLDNISMEAREFSGRASAPNDSGNGPSALEVPALSYASEIKPEDLPF
jgi:single-strand DNA-binding protein